MTDADPPPAVVICDRDDPQAPAVAQYLSQRGVDARWVAPRDIDDVERDLCARRTRHVIVPSLTLLLRAAYREEIALGVWLEPQTRIDAVTPPPTELRALLVELHESWAAHLKQRRRERMIAGAALSVLALGAAFVLLWLAR